MPQQKPKVDYDALANEVRSTVDYDALANEVKGASAPAPVKAPEAPSTMGFLRNVLTSGGNFVSDTVSGAVGLGKLGYRVAKAHAKSKAGDHSEMVALSNDIKAIWDNKGLIKNEAVKAFKKRYGTIDAVLNTLYTDPIGVANDLATVVGTVASGGAMGAAVAGTRVPMIAKAANAARKVEQVVNPLTIPGMAVSKAADLASDGIVLAGVRPSKAIRMDLPKTEGFSKGARGVAQTIKREGLSDSKTAGERAQQSRKSLDNLIAKQMNNPTMQQRIDMDPIISKLENGPMQSAKDRAALGVDVEGPTHLKDRIEYLKKQFDSLNPSVGPDFEDIDIPEHFGGNVTTSAPYIDEMPGNVPPEFHAPRVNLSDVKFPPDRSASLPDAQRFLDEAQTLAYEAGANNQSVQKAANEAIAKALREAMDNAVPGRRDINDRSQRLGATSKALKDMETRPEGLSTKLIAGMVGSGVGSLLDGGTGLVGPTFGGAAGMALDFFPEALIHGGTVVDKAGRQLANPILHRGALAARANEAIGERLMREALLAALAGREQEDQ
jgi:hypothetical protein